MNQVIPDSLTYKALLNRKVLLSRPSKGDVVEFDELRVVEIRGMGLTGAGPGQDRTRPGAAAWFPRILMRYNIIILE